MAVRVLSKDASKSPVLVLPSGSTVLTVGPRAGSPPSLWRSPAAPMRSSLRPVAAGQGSLPCGTSPPASVLSGLWVTT